MHFFQKKSAFAVIMNILFPIKISRYTYYSMCAGHQYAAEIIVVPVGHIRALRCDPHMRQFGIDTAVKQQHRRERVPGHTIYIHVRACA